MTFHRPVLRNTAHLCLASLLIAMSLPALSAAERTRELELVVTDKTVEVSDRNGHLIQSLPFVGEELNDRNREYFAIVEDMNFDGFPDVRILFSQGTVNIYYDWWLWDREVNAFIRYEEGQNFSDPVFDQASKHVSMHERASAYSYMQGELEWQNSRLVWYEKVMVDEAGDGKHVIVSRYLRDPDGELRLVEEEKRLLEEFDDKQIGAIRPPPELSGLNLVLSLPAEPLDSCVLPNGEWWLWQGTRDRTLLIESRRLPVLDYGEESVRGLIRVGWPSAREIAVEPFAALAEKTTYSALKAEFLTGENEDTRLFVAALVFTDGWSFWFVLSAACDAEVSPEEVGLPSTLQLGADLKLDMETLLLGVETADSLESRLMPDFESIAYTGGADSPLRIGVMDALIRIKKIIGPEQSRWVPASGLAYRYDGAGTVRDTPALLFSFGTDSPEKFTAERHFAVDEAGSVYEMDAPAGGEYWLWDEQGVNWWGEYRDGDTVLHIHSYREGPIGMYLVFTFVNGEESVLKGLAPVRGRRAGYEGLVFTISEDDATITVTPNLEAAGENGAREHPSLVGQYSRE